MNPISINEDYEAGTPILNAAENAIARDLYIWKVTQIAVILKDKDTLVNTYRDVNALIEAISVSPKIDWSIRDRADRMPGAIPMNGGLSSCAPLGF